MYLMRNKEGQNRFISREITVEDLSLYEDISVFCDSLEALNWAYRHGLSKSATIMTSSPAMLCSGNTNIQHIEARWSTEELKKFQNTIQKFSEDIFDAVLNIAGIEREYALAISQSAVMFQKVLYKAACLDENDHLHARLFIRVEGNGGPNGNNMNTPWGHLICKSTSFSVINYTLQNDDWNTLNTRGVSYWQRYKIAGIETILYRLAIRVMKYLPNYLFKREVLVPNENELTIEVVASLIKHGVKVSKIELKNKNKNKNITSSLDLRRLYESILPIMQERIEQWVSPSFVEPTILLFKKTISEEIKYLDQMIFQWEKLIVGNDKIKRAVLMNAPGTRKGQALSYVCRRNCIPFISATHGVTVEISRLHGELSVGFDNSVGDAVLCNSFKAAQVEDKSHFSYAKTYVVGISNRHISMKYAKNTNVSVPSIVYISYNIYRGNLDQFVSYKTDYDAAIWESKIINKVLSRLPHNVCYKSYPDDNRRYSDIDPVLRDIDTAKNIELSPGKVDMRYLIGAHRIFITTVATSTLAWPVISGKPVVFINQKERGPLTDDAYLSLSRGLFVFNDDEINFHENLREFLSQPLDKIDKLWEEKKGARKDMIREYFSEYMDGAAGKRSSQIILREYFS